MFVPDYPETRRIQVLHRRLYLYKSGQDVLQLLQHLDVSLGLDYTIR